MMKAPLPFDRLDSEVQKKIRWSENRDEYHYGSGVMRSDDGFIPCFITVSWYPERQWWLYLHDNESLIPLTPELYEKVTRLSL
jgi:hypothetical protein